MSVLVFRQSSFGADGDRYCPAARFSWADIAEGIGRFIDEKIVARFRKDAPRTVGYSDAGEEVPASDGSTDSAADISALYEPTALRQEFEIVKPDLKSAGSQSLLSIR